MTDQASKASEASERERFLTGQLRQLAQGWREASMTTEIPWAGRRVLSQVAEVLEELLAAAPPEDEPANHYLAARFHLRALNGELRRANRRIGAK